jgi:hypothetical protein
MKHKTHFQFRVDIWDVVGGEIFQHIVGVDDFEVATATYQAAIKRWPAARIMLRHGARVVRATGQREYKTLHMGQQSVC